MNATEGSVVTVKNNFVDDGGNPIIPKPGYPTVVLLDTVGDVVVSVPASPDVTVGDWIANLAVPNLGLDEKVSFVVQWRFKAVDGSKYQDKEQIIISPRVERRVSDLVLMDDDTSTSFVLPINLNPADSCSYRFFKFNDPITPDISVFDPTVTVSYGVDRTSFVIPVPTNMQPLLQTYLLRIRHNNGKSNIFTYKAWCINAGMATGMSYLEDFLNKAHIQNVIPELEYAPGDLMLYLERGLDMFNRISYPTSFTGLDMRGFLQDAWLVCSSYYALGAQLMAEGQLSFDFSGQGVSLNVDRTPQLEAALGRIESDIDNRILPLKQKLAKQGITSGNGNVSSLNNSHVFGTLGVLNAPTTRLNGVNLRTYGRFRNF